MFQRLRERFWFIPAMLCLAAAVLAEVLIAIDRMTGGVRLSGWASVFLIRVGESGSRDILGAIASSSLAVAGTTFSITMAVLALTSSSYGPRLVRNFMADRGNQTVLGVYVSTFLYSLLALRSIRVIGDPGNQQADVFIPHLAVNAAVALAIVNVAVLIYFIHHISDSIQISTLAGEVRRDLLGTIDRLYPAEVGHPPGEGGDGGSPGRAAGEAALRTEGAAITTGRSGYLQFVRDAELMRAARKYDVLLDLRVRPGQYLLPDAVVVLVHPAYRADDDLAHDVRAAMEVADLRTPHQDPEFAVQQLTEMAVRALSPGTNDPYTAMNALDDLSVGLALLVARQQPAPLRLDDDGTPRVHALGVDTDELVTSVVDNMRWYASTAPSVMLATLTLVARVGEHTRAPELRRSLLRHVDLLGDAFDAADHHPHDAERFRQRTQEVRAALAAV